MSLLAGAYRPVSGAPSGPARVRVGRRALRPALAASCAMLIASAAQGQLLPQRPVAPTREEVRPPSPERDERARPSLRVEGEIERAPCALDRPENQNVRFTLSSVAFDNLRGLAAADLEPAYADMVGREIPVAAICEIRDRAATILRDAGYVAAVEVPEQRIADGNVRFEVLMARLVGLRVRGDAGRAERTIAGYLERLTGQEVFNRYDAERYLLLAGDLPGYDVRLALRSAGTARGEVIGEVTVVRTPVLVDLTVQNYGSRDLGRFGGLAQAQFFGLTGLGDRTVVGFFTTADFEEQQTLQLAHDFRLGSEGLTLGGQFTYSWANPDLGDPALDVESETLFATFEASYPFIRRERETLRGALGFDYVDQDVEFNSIDFSRDRLRVAFARLFYDAHGLRAGDPRYTELNPVWRLGASGEIRQGLDIFGATEPCGPGFVNCLAPGAVPPSRFEADPTATVLRAAAYGEFRPAPLFTIAAGARGQYSGDPLLSFEEWSAGNYTVGRGYDPGAIIGDSGLGLQGELRYGSIYPTSRTDLAWEAFAFADQAWVENEDLIILDDDQELTSVGAGVRATWGDRVRLEALVAFPLDRTLAEPDRDPRFLISLTTRLWPWSSR